MFEPIDPKAATPIYRQITEQIRRRVAAGTLVPGDQLPSVRELAAGLLVNPNTVAKVYRDLEREGLLETRRGDGTYVSAGASAMAETERRRVVTAQLEEVARDVRAFGISEKDALGLFRQILGDGRPGQKDR
jgi:GntR family transcriptional regulator